MAWDINFTKRFSHAFPVRRSEIPAGTHTYFEDDSLQDFAVLIFIRTSTTCRAILRGWSRGGWQGVARHEYSMLEGPSH